MRLHGCMGCIKGSTQCADSVAWLATWAGGEVPGVQRESWQAGGAARVAPPAEQPAGVLTQPGALHRCRQPAFKDTVAPGPCPYICICQTLWHLLQHLCRDAEHRAACRRRQHSPAARARPTLQCDAPHCNHNVNVGATTMWVHPHEG